MNGVYKMKQFVINGNDEKMRKESKKSLIMSGLGLVALLVLGVLTKGQIPLLLLIGVVILVLVSIHNVLSVGKCKIELAENYFTVHKGGLLGAKVKTYEKHKVGQLKFIETVNSKKKKDVPVEQRDYVVQFQYEGKIVTLTPQTFIGLGQAMAIYFEQPINV